MYYIFTGFEYQPTTRLSWAIDDKQVTCGAVSRAVRAPSRAEKNAGFALAAPPAPVLIGLQAGGRSLASEQRLVYELGYWESATSADLGHG